MDIVHPVSLSSFHVVVGKSHIIYECYHISWTALGSTKDSVADATTQGSYSQQLASCGFRWSRYSLILGVRDNVLPSHSPPQVHRHRLQGYSGPLWRSQPDPSQGGRRLQWEMYPPLLSGTTHSHPVRSMGGRIGYYWVPAGNLSLPSEPQSHVKALSLQILPDSQATPQELKLPTPQSINDCFVVFCFFFLFLFFLNNNKKKASEPLK